MSTGAPTSIDVAVAEQSARSRLFFGLMRNPFGAASMVFLVALVLAAAFAPLLTHMDPNTASATNVLAGPSAAHPLGTDGAGRDVLARMLYGARYTLAGAAFATAVAAAIGISSGLIAGYFGKRFAAVSSWMVSLVMALPGLIVLLAALSVIGSSLWSTMVILGVLLAPAFYRLVYAAVNSVRNELFVDNARVSGVSDATIIARHILTVVRAPIIIQVSIVASIAIGFQAGLDFLGFGDPSLPTWGAVLNDAFTNLYTDPLLLVWPATAIALTCIALTLLANALRDVLERSGTVRRPKANRTLARRTVHGVEEVPGAPIHHEAATSSAAELLRVNGLAVGYGQPDGSVKRVVNDVSLVIRRGEVHGLIGESGSGKTQTAWSILRLLPSGGQLLAGSIVFADQDLATLSGAEMSRIRGARIAYIPQEPMSNLDPSFTVGSQIVEPLRAKLHLSKAEAKSRTLDLLARVGIPDPERTYRAYPHEISGGMAQRVLIAGAVSCNPDLIIADEPTTALDVTVQADILDLLRELQQDLGVSILLVTHNFGVVADLCDHVSVMLAGRIVESGPTASVFAAPQHEYTKSLFGALLEDAEPEFAVSAATVPAERSTHE